MSLRLKCVYQRWSCVVLMTNCVACGGSADGGGRGSISPSPNVDGAPAASSSSTGATSTDVLTTSNPQTIQVETNEPNASSTGAP